MNKASINIVFLLAMLWFPISSFSVEYFVGINGGLISSTVANNDLSNLFRHAFAGYGSISLKPLTFLILEFQLGNAMKGFRYEDEWNEVDSAGNQTSVVHEDKHVFKYDYVEAPILAKISLFRKSPFHPTISLGISLSYLAFAKSDGYTDGKSTIKNHDIKDAFNLIDAGFILGTGLERQLGPGKITFDIRLSIGMLEIYKKIPGSNFQPDKAYNQSFYFLLGYEYKLK
jgi:hypothetical protein